MSRLSVIAVFAVFVKKFGSLVTGMILECSQWPSSRLCGGGCRILHAGKVPQAVAAHAWKRKRF